MQTSSLVVLLFLVCGAHVGHAYQGRALLNSARASSSSSASSTTGGSASASASAKSTGGTATAIASATSEAFAVVESKLVKFLAAVITKTKHSSPHSAYCVDSVALLKKDIIAVGAAVVEAYADALAEVKVDGQGEACASSASSAKAQAEGFVKVFVAAVVKASNQYKTTAEVYAILGGRVDFFASAFATAFANACAGDNSSAFALHESFAQAVIEPFVRVSFFLLAKVDCHGGPWSVAVAEVVAGVITESTKAIATTDTSSSGDASAVGGGDAGALTAQRCSGRYGICCMSRSINKRSCSCSLSSRSSNCDAKREKKDGRTFWNDKAANVHCYC